MDIATLGYRIDPSGLREGVSGMRQLSAEAERTEKASAKFERKLEGIGKAAGATALALAAAAGVVGVTVGRWMRDVVQLGNEIDALAKTANASSQELQGWGYGAESVGVSTGKFADILKDTQDKIGDFIATGGGPLKDFFEDIAPRVGMTAQQFARLSGPEALGAYYRALQQSNLTASEQIYHMENLASDSAKLIPLLRDNAKGFRDWASEADRLGAIIDRDTMKAIQGMREQSTRLDVVMDGLKVTLADRLLPPFERFADLLSDSESQRGLQTLTSFLGDAAGAAVTFAEKIAQAGYAYRKFLGDGGFLPADMLDSTDQIEERIRKLSRMKYGDGILNSARRAIFGDTIDEQLRTAIDELNGFQWRNVISGSSTTPAGGKPRPAGGGGKDSGKGSLRELPDFAKDASAELERLIEQESRARNEFNAWAAELEGPVADANYRYAQDLAELNELARLGAIDSDSLRQAQGRLSEQHEANVRALERQLSPTQELIGDLEHEIQLLQSSTAAQYGLVAARMAGADATEVEVASIERLLGMRDRLYEADRQWQEFGSNVSDSLFDIASGAVSARNGIESFFDRLNEQILRGITDDWADRITDWFKGFAGGGNETAFGTGSYSSGGFWSGLIDSLFGGARAYGGDVRGDRAYRVGEGDRPELLNLGRRGLYLIPGDSGRVEPIGAGASTGGGGDTNISVSVEGHVDRRTRTQIANDIGKEIQRARRNH